MIGTDHLDARLLSFDRLMAQETRPPEISRGCQSNSILQIGMILRSGRRSVQSGNKVYAVFNRVWSINGNQRVGDVILVRDDDGGNSGIVHGAA